MAQGVTTQWDDVQVRFGNYKPREVLPTSEDIFQQNQQDAENIDEWKNKNLKKLNEMVEEDPDLEEDEYLKQYRQKRLEELKVEASKPKFGSIIEITRPDFDIQVHRAPKDVIVVVHLYQDYIPESVLLNRILATLAQKHPNTKFIKIVATKCIENFLDIDCPGILLYCNGEFVDKIMPAAPVFGGKLMTEQTVEFVLSMKKVIQVDLSEYEEDPRKQLKVLNMNITKKDKKRKNSDDEEEEDEDDDREYSTNQLFKYRH